jgi:hypothetical protein
MNLASTVSGSAAAAAAAYLALTRLSQLAAKTNDKEADIFEEIFAGLATEQKPAESFRKLCEDSKSSPRKSLRPPLPPETISFPTVE